MLNFWRLVPSSRLLSLLLPFSPSDVVEEDTTVGGPTWQYNEQPIIQLGMQELQQIQNLK